jgi:PDZ domain
VEQAGFEIAQTMSRRQKLNLKSRPGIRYANFHGVFGSFRADPDLPSSPAWSNGVLDAVFNQGLDGKWGHWDGTAFPELLAALYLHPADQILKIDVIRNGSPMSFEIPVTAYHDATDELSDSPDLQKNLTWELSVFVTDMDDRVKSLLHRDASDMGVVVLAQSGVPNAVDTGLQPGDIIHALAHTSLTSASQLKQILASMKSGGPVVLQIERDGKFRYLAFEME